MLRTNWLRRVSTALGLIALAVGCAAITLWPMGRSGAHAAIATSAPGSGFSAELRTDPLAVRAGQPVSLSFMVRNPKGSVVRFLQFVHEKPLHLLVVSEDLSEFYHIHPELSVDDSYSVRHIFLFGGTYRLYADYTPPGSATIVEQFELRVDGPARPRRELTPDPLEPERVESGLRARLTSDKPLRAGEDLTLKFSLSDASSGRAVDNLQLYLGSLAHFVIVSEDLSQFIHAHPLDAGEVFDPTRDPSLHLHDPAQAAKQLVGPSPSEVSAYVNFPRAGIYKLWAQFQREGRVITMPFVLKVSEGVARSSPATEVAAPSDAVMINVTADGYEPSRITARRGQPIRLAFRRADAQNCAGTVVFPKLNINRQLPAGQTVVIELTPNETGDISFTCGMGMLKGTLSVN